MKLLLFLVLIIYLFLYFSGKPWLFGDFLGLSLLGLASGGGGGHGGHGSGGY